jgi:hypothetical protein
MNRRRTDGKTMMDDPMPETERGRTQLDRVEMQLTKIEVKLTQLLEILYRIRSISPVVSATGAPIVRR